MAERICTRCALHKTCKGPVWGSGDPQANLYWFGEAPGKDEDLAGKPFVGKAGMESDNYKARFGIRNIPQYTGNVVKCRPPGNRDPKDFEIKACKFHFDRELDRMPDEVVIGTLGRFSTAAFLGEQDMDMVHSIPFRHPVNRGWIIVPVYHPAVGMYDGRYMTQISQGYETVANVLAGFVTPEDWTDPYPNPVYLELTPELAKTLSKPKVIAIDTESDHGVPWSIQFATTPGEAYLVRSTSPLTSVIHNWISDPKVLVVLHNAQHDLPMMAKMGLYPSNWTDTMLIANLLCDVPRGLKALAFRLCGMKMQSYMDLVTPYNNDLIVPYLEEISGIEWPEPDAVLEIKDGKKRWKKPQALHKRVNRMFSDWEKGKLNNFYERWMNQPQVLKDQAAKLFGPAPVASIANVDPDKAIYYACRDADATLRVFPKLMERLKAYQLENVLELDCGIVEMLAKMEEVGVGVSVHKLEVLDSYCCEIKEDMLNEIHEGVGYWINPQSSDQVSELLYRKLRLRRPLKHGVPTGGTDHDHLEKIKFSHPVIPRILAYREADKLQGSFVDRLLRMRDHDNRVHDDISQIRTTSGRLASSIMLLIPKKGEMATPLRECFVAKPGCVFLSADYSQIELRVLAHMSRDPVMLKAYRDGLDIHAITASKIFGVPLDQVDKMKHRHPAKTVNFGIVYGMTAAGLYEQLGQYGWTEESCDKLIRQWFALYKGAKDLMHNIWQHAKRYGFVTTLSGRRRLTPEVRSVHPWIREKGLRNAGNHPIQGTANEIMKKAMKRLYAKYRVWRKDFYIEPIIQVHDDLKWEMEEGRLMSLATVIRDVMEESGELCIPTPVDMEYGADWGNMKGLEVN